MPQLLDNLVLHLGKLFKVHSLLALIAGAESATRTPTAHLHHPVNSSFFISTASSQTPAGRAVLPSLLLGFYGLGQEYDAGLLEGILFDFLAPAVESLHEFFPGSGQPTTLFVVSPCLDEFEAQHFFRPPNLAPGRPVAHAQLFRGLAQRSEALDVLEELRPPRSEGKPLVGLQPEMKKALGRSPGLPRDPRFPTTRMPPSSTAKTTGTPSALWIRPETRAPVRSPWRYPYPDSVRRTFANSAHARRVRLWSHDVAARASAAVILSLAFLTSCGIVSPWWSLR